MISYKLVGANSAHFFTRFNKENIMRLNTDRNLLLSTVGFERLFDSLNNLSSGGFEHKNPSYPPYNIFKESESTYLIEIAVAGFKQNEIDITSEDKKLIIEGKTSDKKTEEYTEKEYLHRGLARRDFIHEFVLAETVVVEKANISDGILTVELKNIIPEEKKPRKIKINSAEKSLLTN